MLAHLLEQEPSQSIIGDMFHQLQEEIGKLTFFGQLWGFLKMFLRRYFDTVNQILLPQATISRLHRSYFLCFQCIQPASGVRSLRINIDPYKLSGNFYKQILKLQDQPVYLPCFRFLSPF